MKSNKLNERILFAKQFGVRFSEFFNTYVGQNHSKKDYASSISVSTVVIDNWPNGKSIPSGDKLMQMIRLDSDVN